MNFLCVILAWFCHLEPRFHVNAPRQKVRGWGVGGLPPAQQPYLSHSRAPHLPCGRGCSQRASCRLHRWSKWCATSVSGHASLPEEKSLGSGKKGPGARELGLPSPLDPGQCQSIPSGSRAGEPRYQALDAPRKGSQRRGSYSFSTCWVAGSECAYVTVILNTPIRPGRKALLVTAILPKGYPGSMLHAGAW